MDTMLSILLGLAVVLFLFIAVVFLFEPIRNLMGKKTTKVEEDDMPFDYIPSRTMANTSLVWEDRRQGPRRSEEGGDGSGKEEAPLDERKGGERRQQQMRPPFPE